jgi:hypothetical protein
MPALANTSANRSRYISLTAEKPCAITIVGAGAAAPSGAYSQPRRVTPSALNSMSSLITLSSFADECNIRLGYSGRINGQ